VDVNAFACGDGSIRVFSALMDLMDDDELMAISGHEIGHVVHADVNVLVAQGHGFGHVLSRFEQFSGVEFPAADHIVLT